MIPDREALEAYNLIKAYCRERVCQDCIFGVIGARNECAMIENVPPEKWQELEIK